jgi:hypothetical protein
MKKKPIKKNLNDDLFNTASSASNIQNYTMWPTATIKKNIEVVPSKHSETLDSTTVENNITKLSIKPIVTPLK